MPASGKRTYEQRMRFFRALFRVVAALALAPIVTHAHSTTITATGVSNGSGLLARGQIILIEVTPNDVPQTFSADGQLYPAGDLARATGGCAEIVAYLRQISAQAVGQLYSDLF